MGPQMLRADHTGRRCLPVYKALDAGTPCHQCPKVPRNEPAVPESAVELDEQGWAIYAHYMECKAVGRFPDDETVMIHAGVIRSVEDDYYLGGAAGLGEQMTALGRVILAALTR